MTEPEAPAGRGWRGIERHAYVERPYESVWTWLAGHLSTLGEPLPGGGRAVDLRIRPAGKDISRPVRLHVGGVVCGEDRARASLGWADAAHPQLFPHLEGVLEIAPVPYDAAPFTQISIRARYRPPFGPLGAIADRLVGGDVTDVALTTLLDDLTAAVADHLPPPSMDDSRPGPAARPADEPPEVRRALLTIDGLTTRPGGAAAMCEEVMRLPGVVHASLNPFAGLVAVDHDPAATTTDEIMAVLEGSAGAPSARA